MANGAEHSRQVLGWAARDSSGTLSPFNFSRRANGPEDVTIKILYCGICHTDLHFLKNDWGYTVYPVVPGMFTEGKGINRQFYCQNFGFFNGVRVCRHEITGIVTEVGSNVKGFQIGDRAGVGCLVGACHACDSCDQGLENYCDKSIMSYNGIYWDGTLTYGGYSSMIVVHQRYAVRFPENLPMDAGAPLLCAGITVYSPMKYYGMTQPGKHLGVVGLGGLGHMAVKFGKAFGLKVTVISTSPDKEKEAREHLGADGFLVSKNPQQMQEAAKTLDYLVDTVSAEHPLAPLLTLLKVNGKMVLVGLADKPLQLYGFPLAMGRRTIGGSMIGGMKETQEMIDFCGKHNITCEIEKIGADYLNTAMERLQKSDVRYRFVIDIGEWAARPARTDK